MHQTITFIDGIEARSDFTTCVNMLFALLISGTNQNAFYDDTVPNEDPQQTDNFIIHDLNIAKPRFVDLHTKAILVIHNLIISKLRFIYLHTNYGTGMAYNIFTKPLCLQMKLTHVKRCSQMCYSPTVHNSSLARAKTCSMIIYCDEPRPAAKANALQT